MEEALTHLTNQLVAKAKENAMLEARVKELEKEKEELEEQKKGKDPDEIIKGSALCRAQSAEEGLLTLRKRCTIRNLTRNIEYAKSNAQHIDMVLRSFTIEDDSEMQAMTQSLLAQWIEILKILSKTLDERVREYDKQIEEIRRGTPLSELMPMDPVRVPHPPGIDPLLIKKIRASADRRHMKFLHSKGAERGGGAYSENGMEDGDTTMDTSSMNISVSPVPSISHSEMSNGSGSQQSSNNSTLRQAYAIVRTAKENVSWEEFVNVAREFHTRQEKQALRKLTVEEYAYKLLSIIQQEEEEDEIRNCPVCKNDILTPAMACPKCGIHVHTDCLNKFVLEFKKCPSDECNQPLGL